MAEGWTIGSLIEALERRGGEPALQWLEGEQVASLGAAELADLARRLARGLLEAGLEPGQCVGLVGPNSAAWVTVRLAIGAAGGVAAAIDDLAESDEIEQQARDSGCRFLFAAPHHLETAQPLAGKLGFRLYALDGIGQGEDAEEHAERDVESWRVLLSDAERALPAVEPSSEAMLVHTSGTTGAPKVFALTYEHLWANIEALSASGLAWQGDRFLLPLPLHHVYPLTVGLLTPLHLGASVIFPEGVTGPLLRNALTRAEPTLLIGVPRLYAALVAAVDGQVAARGKLVGGLLRRLFDLAWWVRRKTGLNLGRRLFGFMRARIAPSLRLLVSGGAKLDWLTEKKLAVLGWDVRSGYGLAETASVFTGNLPGATRLGSEGKPFGVGQVRIVPLEETEDREDTAQGPVGGEIQLKGPSVFSGYRDNEEANATAFTEDGWFRTGDLGHIDEDGYLFVTGRAKELIVLGGGKNVFPEELEKHYGKSDYVQEVAVLEKDGNLVAVAVPDQAAIKAAGLTRPEEAVRVSLTELGRALPAYQRLSGLALLREPPPRTRLGKYRRFLLPKLYEDAKAGRQPEPREPSAEDKALMADPKAAVAVEILAARTPGGRVDPDADLAMDLNIDSLGWVSVSLEMESRLGITLPEETVARLATVRDLLQAVRDAEPGEGGAPAPELDDWLAERPWSLRAAAGLLHGLNALLMKLLFRFEARGREHLPADAPFLVVANHASDMDPGVVAAALTPALRRRLTWSGNRNRLFQGPVSRLFSRTFRVFPVDERDARNVIASGRAVLEKGEGLVWFPESWRTPDGELQRFLPGVGEVVQGLELPIVPVYLDGTFEAWPRHRSRPSLARVRAFIGAPVTARELAAGGTGSDAERIAEALRERVAALAPKNG